MKPHPARCLALAFTVCFAPAALATDPPVILNDNAFEYNEDGYIGANFGFGTQLSQFSILGDGTHDISTGLLGNVVPLNGIGDGSQFNNGSPIPLAEQNAADLPDTFMNANLGGLFGSVEFSGQGDAQGFTSFTATHRAFTSVTNNQLNILENARADTYSQAVFQVQGQTLQNLVRLSIIADALLGIDSTGAGSSGIRVQLINVTDENNQFLVQELSGFFFQDGDALIPTFLDLVGDEVGNFTNTFDPQSETFLNEYAVSFDMLLDSGETYALNIVSDVAASINGSGSAFLDSSNSLNVSLTTLDTGSRLVVPTPGALALFGTGLLAAGRRRH